ncbi:uncharacterized protein LOC120078011 [Benincasa hispida]|uniref:uncharacterized protein LOC120078011 n=1 Tax=Benincasa hispida TaxID=102211 RepID=UPI0019006E70|nr:uncharacterized protein LOC120078011 [Benincasa hispida]
MATATIALLSTDKLTDDNYASCKHMITIIPIIEDLMFALTEERSPIPAPNAARNVREAYKHWTRANEKARAYILASLSHVFAKKHELIVLAHEIMESVQGMFE